MRPLSALFEFGATSRPALAIGQAGRAPARVLLRGERAARAPRWLAFGARSPRGFGLALSLALIGGVGALGALRGGQYQAFAERNGALPDFLARAAGLGISAVTISGQSELREPEILAAAGIGPKGSLLFLDAAEARRKLEALPLVKQASVRKLYPDQVVIEIKERTAYALWQEGGEVRTVAIDGTPIDQMRDQRFIALPFVVGKGANEHLAEFAALLEAAGDVGPRIAAGVYVGERRWNLKMASGLDVKLPEAEPAAAVAELAKLERQSRILERDVLALDFRVEGRVFAKLSEQAAAARALAEHGPKKAAL